MSYFTADNLETAHEIISRYPRKKSALIPLLHLAQEQEGWVTDDAMRQIAELTDTTPAEVKGTGSFYEMFKFHPVGTYMINVCTNLACQLLGGEELLAHAEEALGIKAGGTTADGMFTIEDVECIARAPRLRACRSTIATSFGSPPTISISSSTTSATGGPPTSPSTARSAWSVSTSGRCRCGHRGAGAGHRTTGLARPKRHCRRRRRSLMPTHDYVPHAPGYVDNDGPKIVTSRFVHEDSHTLERYEATNGYDGLRRALDRTPADVHEEVRDAVVLGRGGAGFPAGVKWGFMPPGKFPYYLVVNGDESEPGTYKDRLLMERDPHQLIEGCLITCYALGLSQCFLYVRGEMPAAQENLAQALNEAYAKGYVGKNIMGTEFSVDITLTWGAGAYIVGEETALIESLEGNRGCAPQAAVLPGCNRPLWPAHDRQQCRDTEQPSLAARQRLRAVQGVRLGGFARFAHGRRVRSREPSRRVRDRTGRHDLPRSLLRRQLLSWDPQRQRTQDVRARRRFGPLVLPGATRPPSRGAPSVRKVRCSARAPSW